MSTSGPTYPAQSYQAPHQQYAPQYQQAHMQQAPAQYHQGLYFTDFATSNTFCYVYFMAVYFIIQGYLNVLDTEVFIKCYFYRNLTTCTSNFCVKNDDDCLKCLGICCRKLALQPRLPTSGEPERVLPESRQCLPVGTTRAPDVTQTLSHCDVTMDKCMDTCDLVMYGSVRMIYCTWHHLRGFVLSTLIIV